MIQSDELVVDIGIPKVHDAQRVIQESQAKRKVVRAGRRFGKTVLAAIIAVKLFASGRRILYAVPTQEQVDRFWKVCKIALENGIESGVIYKNETKHILELPGTETRIKAKTAWNADTMRGDYADFLILDEYQLMKEEAWNEVGAPMLLDNDGDAMFIFTQKLRGALHARKMFKKAQADTTGRWAYFSYSSHANPHISKDALKDITDDMTHQAFQMEIMSIDEEDVPGALWTSELIEDCRVTAHPPLYRIGVAIDPAATSGTHGIIVGGISNKTGDGQIHGYVLEDVSRPGKPVVWGKAAITCYNKYGADVMVGEINNGGDMIENVIINIPGGEFANYKSVRATKGKYTRAEPIAAIYENKRLHHVGTFEDLEEQMRTYVPGDPDSPDNYDAMVWLFTELMLDGGMLSWANTDDLGTIEDFEDLSRWR